MGLDKRQRAIKKAERLQKKRSERRQYKNWIDSQGGWIGVSMVENSLPADNPNMHSLRLLRKQFRAKGINEGK